MDVYTARIQSIIEQSDMRKLTAKAIRKQIQGEYDVQFSGDLKDEFDKFALDIFRTKLLANPISEKVVEAQGAPIIVSKPVKAKTVHKPQKVKVEKVTKVKKEVDVNVPRKRAKVDYGHGGENDEATDELEQSDYEMNPELDMDDVHEQESEVDDFILSDQDIVSRKPTKKSKVRSKTKSAANATGVAKKGGFGQCTVTPELAAILGTSLGQVISRGEVTKLLWVYIKAHDLQDPSNKRMIVPDSTLAAVIGGPVSMMKLSTLCKPHIVSVAAVKTEEELEKQAKKEERKGKGGSGGFNQVYRLSHQLEALLGKSALSRPKVVKYLWKYIKKNALQSSANGTIIENDALMQAVFGVPSMGMFAMNKLLAPHLQQADTELTADISS